MPVASARRLPLRRARSTCAGPGGLEQARLDHGIGDQPGHHDGGSRQTFGERVLPLGAFGVSPGRWTIKAGGLPIALARPVTLYLHPEGLGLDPDLAPEGRIAG
nr:hypothetical protein [uncultured Brevundimonas sp.]